MTPQDRYDSLIQHYAGLHGLNWKIVKAQMLAESSANPGAVSPVGARGLMQIMPATFREVALGESPFDPEVSIKVGCKYLREQYDKFSEIPDETQRYCFALAAYNAGRGNINKMLEFARKASGAPRSFKDWDAAGRPSGPWQNWDFASRFLSLVTGHHANETLGYVRKIMGEV